MLMEWIAIYLAGMVVTLWASSKFGWMPGTPLWKKIVVTTLMIGCWPIFWIAMLLMAIDNIGVPQR